MARAIVHPSKDGKRHTKEGDTVAVSVGSVIDKEYYELTVTATSEAIVVVKSSSKDPSTKEVYRVPAKPKVRKKASAQPGGTDSSEA